MSREQENAETMALRKIQESDLWWNAFHKSVREWRRMNVYYVGCRRRLEIAQTGRFPLRSELMVAMQNEMDYAHDILLSIVSDLQSSARSAVSCEMAHTIYRTQREKKFWGGEDGEYND
jgi:hypothetical protein